MNLSDYTVERKSDRAFLIGNGPSLTAPQVGQLMNEDTFAMNNIAAMFPKTMWRPTYYVGVSSALRLPEYRAQMMKGIKASTHAFVDGQFRKWPFENMIYLPTHHGGKTHLEVDWRWWFDDITEGVCRWGTSMYATMQIAAYLGYKELNLIGVDGHYTGNWARDHHSVEDTVGNLPVADPDAINRDHLIAHLMAQINCMRLGVQVYNCTNGGTLTVYERRTLREALRD